MKPRFQFSVRMALVVTAVVAVFCGTPLVTGPPFTEGHADNGQVFSFPNALWFAATLFEIFVVLLVVNIRMALQEKREREQAHSPSTPMSPERGCGADPLE